MPQARSTLVSLDDTPWYHCVSRCVRRAFLCGEDHFSGRNFDHRRGWIAERIKTLAAIFAIDIAAYAVMSNHYHIVVHIDRERALDWSVDEVLRRWIALFSGPLLVNRYLSNARSDMSEAELQAVQALAETYRTRLYDLSWFMRTLNEYVARLANAEEGVKGRFWEGRFKSQALLDEAAVLTAMAYVDLNPIRVGLAETLEASDYTSIQERLGTLPQAVEAQETVFPMDIEAGRLDDETLQPEAAVHALPAALLMPFDITGQTPWAIPFAFEDYVEWVEWMGRAVHPTQRGFIPDRYPPLFARLGIDGDRFIEQAEHFLQRFGTAVGAPDSMVQHCARRQTQFLWGMRTARKVFHGQQAA